MASLSRGAVLCVVGARPNFIKIAPIIDALRDGRLGPAAHLIHTGQHYDAAMKDAIITQLGIPEPDVDLEVGSASHALQTAEIMRRFESVVESSSPSAVLVVGDVNSTIACALVAAKRGVPVVHVEAGLRSFDRGMPEEINRVLTDQISELLFTTEASARGNLLREGINGGSIHFVGNVMIDTLVKNRPHAVPGEQTLERLSGGEISGPYAVATLHRPSNVDDCRRLEDHMRTLARIGDRLPLVFPIHPRTEKAVARSGLDSILREAPGVLLTPALGYLEMLGLMADARLVLTDSGGMQEETTALGVPCITLRDNTERPITVEQGTNTVVGTDPRKILAAVDDVLTTGGKAGRVPDLWDGKAAQRIREVMQEWLQDRGIRSCWSRRK